MTLYVDPPDGWRFGFPKAVPQDREADLLNWIVEQGYPKPMIDWYGDKFPLRCWREEEKDNE